MNEWMKVFQVSSVIWKWPRTRTVHTNGTNFKYTKGTTLIANIQLRIIFIYHTLYYMNGSVGGGGGGGGQSGRSLICPQSPLIWYATTVQLFEVNALHPEGLLAYLLIDYSCLLLLPNTLIWSPMYPSMLIISSNWNTHSHTHSLKYSRHI